MDPCLYNPVRGTTAHKQPTVLTTKQKPIPTSDIFNAANDITREIGPSTTAVLSTSTTSDASSRRPWALHAQQPGAPQGTGGCCSNKTNPALDTWRFYFVAAFGCLESTGRNRDISPAMHHSVRPYSAFVPAQRSSINVDVFSTERQPKRTHIPLFDNGRRGRIRASLPCTQ